MRTSNAFDDLIEDPYPSYARLRRETPVWQVPGSDAFFVSTWDLVAEAARRVEDFSNHFRHTLFRTGDGGLGVAYSESDGALDALAGADPPQHTDHRRLFFPELVQDKMDAVEGFVASLADELLDVLLASSRGDVTAGLANPLPLQVSAERVIGFREVEIGQLQRWVFGGSQFMSGRMQFDDMAELAGEVAGLLPWVSARLDDALVTPRTGDVLGAAAGGVRDGVLTRDQAAFTLMVLLGASGETTTSLIGNSVRVLAERPALQDELRAEPERVSAFVEEVLRFEAPFRFHHRTATRATELGGVEIPERALVALLWGAANRDEAVFEHPDEFVVGRRNARLHFGFGRGIHHCVGAPLARLETRVVLAKLLERTHRFALDPADPPAWVDSLWIRRHERLPIIFA